jgi:plastocyanin
VGILGGSLLALPLRPASAATVNIAVSGTIGQYWFCNSSYQNGVCPTTINQGDTVNWMFNGDFYSFHASKHCGADCNTPTGSPLWDSGVMQVGNYSYIFNTPGVYLYQCSVHTSLMRGQITVLAAGVGGEAELADTNVGAVRSAPSNAGLLGTWLGVSALAGGMTMLICAAWFARRLVRDEASG